MKNSIDRGLGEDEVVCSRKTATGEKLVLRMSEGKAMKGFVRVV